MKENNLLNMNILAQHVIAVANNNQLLIVHRQLQLVMYFALKKILQDNLMKQSEITKLYDEPFLVWRYGPTVAKVDVTYRIWGADPITQQCKENSELKFLDSYIVHLLKQNMFILMYFAQHEKFWQEHEKDIMGWRSNIAYSLDDVKK